MGVAEEGPPQRLGHQGRSGEEDSPRTSPYSPCAPKTPWEHRGEAQNREPGAGKRGEKETAEPVGPWRPQAGHYWDSGQWPLGLQPQRPSRTCISQAQLNCPLRSGVLAKVSRAGGGLDLSHALLGQALTLGPFHLQNTGGIECSNPAPSWGRSESDEGDDRGEDSSRPQDRRAFPGTRPHQPQPHPRGEEEEELPAVLPGLPGQEVPPDAQGQLPCPTCFPGASMHIPEQGPWQPPGGRAQPHLPIHCVPDRRPSPTQGDLRPKERPSPQARTPRPLPLASLPLHSQYAWRVLPGTPQSGCRPAAPVTTLGALEEVDPRVAVGAPPNAFPSTPACAPSILQSPHFLPPWAHLCP